MLEVYRDLAENWLALPVITGLKTDNERFRGAVRTYCIEAMMRDGKALQAGTSHYLGQNFATAFNIQFQNAAGELEYAYQTSWGVSTRLVGAVVMGHGDEKGLILPPKIAPIQVVIVPIYKTDADKSRVTERCRQIAAELKASGIRVHLDDRDQHTPGFKFNYWEQKGVPVRLNIGPKDVDKNVVEVARRDNGEKIRDVSQDGLSGTVAELLVKVQQAIFDRALALRKANTVNVSTYAEFKEVLKEKNCFIEAYFAGTNEDETKIKEETKATIRAIPFDQPTAEGKCFYTGKPASKKVVLAIAY